MGRPLPSALSDSETISGRERGICSSYVSVASGMRAVRRVVRLV